MRALSIENLVDTGKGVVKIGAVAATAMYLTLFGMNHLISDLEYRSENKHSVTRADGLFGSTEFTRWLDTGSDTVWQYRSFGTSKSYQDGGLHGERDGEVDKITITESRWRLFGFRSQSHELTRDTHYLEYQEKFDEADRDLAKTKKRFNIQDPEPSNPGDLYREPHGLIV